MCLVAQISELATEDIHVYKILRAIKDLSVEPEMRFSFDGKKIVTEINVDFVSPYYPQTCWEVGETKTLSEDHINPFMFRFGNFIEGGYFHSYSQNEFEKVKKLCDKANNDLILFEATIPRGTSYYQGVVEYEGTESYASKALRIDKMVEGQQNKLASIKFRLKNLNYVFN